MNYFQYGFLDELCPSGFDKTADVVREVGKGGKPKPQPNPPVEDPRGRRGQEIANYPAAQEALSEAGGQRASARGEAAGRQALEGENLETRRRLLGENLDELEDLLAISQAEPGVPPSGMPPAAALAGYGAARDRGLEALEGENRETKRLLTEDALRELQTRMAITGAEPGVPPSGMPPAGALAGADAALGMEALEGENIETQRRLTEDALRELQTRMAIAEAEPGLPPSAMTPASLEAAIQAAGVMGPSQMTEPRPDVPEAGMPGPRGYSATAPGLASPSPDVDRPVEGIPAAGFTDRKTEEDWMRDLMAARAAQEATEGDFDLTRYLGQAMPGSLVNLYSEYAQPAADYLGTAMDYYDPYIDQAQESLGGAYDYVRGLF